MKHLKVLVKWDWWWNFACVSTKSLNFEIYFLSFPWEIIFRCYFRQLFMYLALKKCKNDCKIFKILWYRFLSTKTWNYSIFYRISSQFLTVELSFETVLFSWHSGWLIYCVVLSEAQSRYWVKEKTGKRKESTTELLICTLRSHLTWPLIMN